MILDKNGRRLSRKMTRYINIRYYFITDSIIKQYPSVEFCPALDMIGDYFTKALQGYKFRRLRNIIIVIHEYDIPAYNIYGRALLEERKLILKKEK